jgi:hypothetical protein
MTFFVELFVPLLDFTLHSARYPKSRERDQQATCVEHGWREELWALTRFGAQWVKPRDSGSLAHAPAYFSVKRTASVPR